MFKHFLLKQVLKFKKTEYLFEFFWILVYYICLLFEKHDERIPLKNYILNYGNQKHFFIHRKDEFIWKGIKVTDSVFHQRYSYYTYIFCMMEIERIDWLKLNKIDTQSLKEVIILKIKIWYNKMRKDWPWVAIYCINSITDY